jgi:hypothetical protein
MSAKANQARPCAVCGATFAPRDLIPAAGVRQAVAKDILRDHPEWSSESYICRADLNRFRAKYDSLLESERGELTSLEQEVVHSLRDHEFLAKNVEAEFEQEWSFGERLADRIAAFGGSWTFLICFAGFLAVWILVNSLVLLWRPVDPYPFILLNLVLSCLAAIPHPGQRDPEPGQSLWRLRQLGARQG